MPEHRDIHPEDRETMGRMPVADLKGKTIISLSNGEKIGQVDDVLVDPESLMVSGLLVTQGGLFDREKKIISAQDVDKWGKDTVLVSGIEVFHAEGELPGREHWLSASDKLNGLTVVNTQGERLGQIDDVIIDDSGRFVAYRVSSGMGRGDSREIPATATKTLGKDVAIVDTGRMA